LTLSKGKVISSLGGIVKKSKLFFALLLLGSFFAGCTYHYDKGEDNTAILNKMLADPDVISYGLVKRYVLDKKCMSCHTSGKHDLSSYELVKANIDDIENEVFIMSEMPPSIPLTPAEAGVLKSWIDQGAPEVGKKPFNVPKPKPLVATFKSINENILQTKCVACHSADGKAKKVPFTSYAAIITSDKKLVVPGDPQNSALVISISRTDDKRMPPAKVAKPLSEEEIQAITTWIQEGAKP
jgi:uncharacterized membrane protein